jgi:hypothetical protein
MKTSLTKERQSFPDTIRQAMERQFMGSDENLERDGVSEKDDRNNRRHYGADDICTPTEKRFGEDYGIGKIIARAAGVGDGYASSPWILDEYERTMGITPTESWLLKRLIKHSWNFGDYVYISMRKIARDSMISSSTLNKVRKSLLNKGFLFIVKRGDGTDRRIRYDIRRVYFALHLSIVTDPDSKLPSLQGLDRSLQNRLPKDVLSLIIEDLPLDKRLTVGIVNQLLNQKGFTLDWWMMKLIDLPHPEILHKSQKQSPKFAIQFSQSIQNPL